VEPGLVRFKDPQDFSGIVGRGTALSDLYLQVRINGDVALLKGIAKELLAAGAVDREFIRGKTHGWDAFAADLERESFDDLTAQSGISREQMRPSALFRRL
jgi:anaerobic selenocysteine-containing dehydrogenase